MVLDDLLMGDVELVGVDGGVLEGGEGLEGADALGLGAEGEEHHGLELGVAELVHGDFGEPAKERVEGGGLGDGEGFGMCHVTRFHGGDDGLESGEDVARIGAQPVRGTTRSHGCVGLSDGVEHDGDALAAGDGFVL